MSTTSKIVFAVLLLSATDVWAQPYGYLSRATVPVEAVEPEPESNANAAALEQAMQNIAEELAATSAIPEGLRGRVQQGLLPDIFARNSRPQVAPAAGVQSPLPGRQRGSGRGMAANGQQTRGSQNGGTQAGSSNPVNGFVANAFQFDSNGDGQLAAHEMSNLFLVLTTTMNAERTGQSLDGSVTSGQDSVNYELMQLQSVREAQSLFLQLGMSFDNNSDGQLNQAEVRTMGSCLAQNNNSLIGAALQNNPSIMPVLQQQVVPLSQPSPSADVPQ